MGSDQDKTRGEKSSPSQKNVLGNPILRQLKDCDLRPKKNTSKPTSTPEFDFFDQTLSIFLSHLLT
jgi:hypothetical protein